MPHRSYSRHAAIGVVVLLAFGALFLSVRPFGNQVENSRHTRVQGDIQGINTQLKLYQTMNGFYPTTEQGLAALVSEPDTPPRPTRWYQLYSELPLDPWGNGYVYRSPGTKHPEGFDLFSSGPDHKPDTKDDDWGH